MQVIETRPNGPFIIRYTAEEQAELGVTVYQQRWTNFFAEALRFCLSKGVAPEKAVRFIFNGGKHGRHSKTVQRAFNLSLRAKREVFKENLPLDGKVKIAAWQGFGPTGIYRGYLHGNPNSCAVTLATGETKWIARAHLEAAE